MTIQRSPSGQLRETPWDDLHVAYFQGEALSTYLNTPFLYTQKGFETEEVAPIVVDGETWRRLKITFPDHIKSHNVIHRAGLGGTEPAVTGK